MFHRLGLAGQGRFVDHGRRERVNTTVHRDDLAGLDQEQITDDDVGDGYVCCAVACQSVSDARSTIEQETQLAPRSASRPRFERATAGQHHSDHGAGERLTDDQRPCEGEQRDDVDPEAMGRGAPR